MILTLRDYQRADVERLRAEYRKGARAVLYQAPTGSGKTVLFANIVESAVARGSRVWIVVHRQELLDQTSRALTMLQVPHGIVAAGRASVTSPPVLVCGVQTLVRRLYRIGPVDLIVLDEAHHASAGTWDKVIRSRPEARLLGVTATPERLDGKGLGEHFDALVVGPSVAELTTQGYLAPAKVYIPPQVADLANLKIRGGDYAVSESASRLDRPTVTGDAISHYERICPGSPALVFCTRIVHAENVAKAFRERGWKAESIDGTLSDKVRRQRIEALGDGRLNVLTSCEIVSEGTDIPIVTAAILLRPTQSLGLYLQQVGRVLRPAPGKSHAIILDHVGNVGRHGFPDDDRTWSLEGRRKGQKGAIEQVAMRACPSCFAAFRPAPICPYCGAAYPIKDREVEEVQGELVEATEDHKLALQIQRRREVGRARDRESLERIAAERGYKPGWVENIMRARARKSA